MGDLSVQTAEEINVRWSPRWLSVFDEGALPLYFSGVQGLADDFDGDKLGVLLVDL